MSLSLATRGIICTEGDGTGTGQNIPVPVCGVEVGSEEVGMLFVDAEDLATEQVNPTISTELLPDITEAEELLPILNTSRY